MATQILGSVFGPHRSVALAEQPANKVQPWLARQEPRVCMQRHPLAIWPARWSAMEGLSLPEVTTFAGPAPGNSLELAAATLEVRVAVTLVGRLVLVEGAVVAAWVPLSHESRRRPLPSVSPRGGHRRHLHRDTCDQSCGRRRCLARRSLSAHPVPHGLCRLSACRFHSQNRRDRSHRSHQSPLGLPCPRHCWLVAVEEVPSAPGLGQFGPLGRHLRSRF